MNSSNNVLHKQHTPNLALIKRQKRHNDPSSVNHVEDNAPPTFRAITVNGFAKQHEKHREGLLQQQHFKIRVLKKKHKQEQKALTDSLWEEEKTHLGSNEV